MVHRMVGRCAASGAGSGAIADVVGSKTPLCMEVQSRVGDQEKPVSEILYSLCLSSKSVWILSVVALVLCQVVHARALTRHMQWRTEQRGLRRGNGIH
jgi:hypothetical protein